MPMNGKKSLSPKQGDGMASMGRERFAVIVWGPESAFTEGSVLRARVVLARTLRGRPQAEAPRCCGVQSLCIITARQWCRLALRGRWSCASRGPHA